MYHREYRKRMTQIIKINLGRRFPGVPKQTIIDIANKIALDIQGRLPFDKIRKEENEKVDV